MTYTYDATKANGRTIDGVPCRDLTEGDVKRLSPSQRAAVKSAPFFVENKPAPTPAPAKASGKDKGELTHDN